MRAFNVVFREFKRVAERVIDVTLRRKVHDGVYFFALQDVIQKVDGTNVSVNELDVRQMFDMFQIFQTSAVVKFVKYDDL